MFQYLFNYIRLFNGTYDAHFALAFRAKQRIDVVHLRTEAAWWPVEPLKIALKDENMSVRESAAKSHSMIGDK